MSKRKSIYFFLAIIFIFGLIFFRINVYVESHKLQVAFLDVGQGDAILISEGGKQILIDGGPSGQKLLEKLGEYVPFWDRKIDIVIATHPDADHITGLVDVLKNYAVDEVIESGAESQSQVFKAMEKIIEDKKIEKQIARQGMNMKISTDTELKILGPSEMDTKNSKDTNSASIVARLSFGKNSFLFTGDLPMEVETRMLKNNLFSAINILKISHHGSRFATSGQFLGITNPQDAIISVGKGNRYGHPANEVLDRLRERKINILRTDDLGDVVYGCDNIKNECKTGTINY